MRAMILAAGFGTRLVPLTDSVPKALVQIKNKTLLEILVGRLEKASFSEIVINGHYLSQQIEDYIRFLQERYECKISYSHEKEILDTGGGIKKMLEYFKGPKPILVHNVDVLTDLDYKRMIDYHIENKCRATLAVKSITSDRNLWFDKSMHLCGKREPGQFQDLSCEPDGKITPYEFCGIQVISPDLFKENDSIKFSSITLYLHQARQGQIIKGFPIDEYYWRDVGTHSDLQQAETDVNDGIYFVN